MSNPGATGIAICGGGYSEAWLHRRAFLESGYFCAAVFCDDAALAAARAEKWNCKSHGEIGAVLSDPGIGIVILLSPMPGRAEAAFAALDAGKHVVIGPPFAEENSDARRLAAAAMRKSGPRIICFENRFFLPPLEKALRMADRKTVGRATAVRMRSLLAGAGGWDSFLNPGFDSLEPAEQPDLGKYFFRETFEKISIAIKLFGPVEEIYARRREPGGGALSAVVTWKHRAHATYGALDIGYAPEMTIRSAFEPRDDSVEITGSSGIIWAAAGGSQLRNAPLLHVYRRDMHYEFGDIDNCWAASYTRCARVFIECIRAGAPAPVDPRVSAAAVDCALAAHESAASSRRIKLR